MHLIDQIKQMIAEQDRANGIVRMAPPRDFVPCSFCGGGSMVASKGCAACYQAREQRSLEVDEEYDRLFPNGPQPIYSVDTTKPGAWEEARSVIGREALEKAFSPGGGGVQEIEENCKRTRKA